MHREINLTLLTPDGKKEIIPAWPGITLATALAVNGWKVRADADRTMLDVWKLQVIGAVSHMASRERKRLTPEEVEQGIRLAHFYIVEEPVEVHLSDVYGKTDVWENIQWEQLAQNLPWQYTSVYLPGRQMNLPGILQENHQAFYDRIANTLTDYRILLDAQELKDMAFLDRPGRPVIELKALTHTQRQEIYSLTRKAHPITGVILSLETETVTLILVDLKSGQKLGQSIQSSVIYERLSEAASRKVRSKANPTTSQFEELHQALRQQIQNMMENLLQEQGNIRPRDIYRTVVIGQTALLHVLLAVPPVDASRPGLHAIFYQEMQLCPQGQVPEMNPWGEYIILQQWGHMVGSDALAACLALHHTESEPVLTVQPVVGGNACLQQGSRVWASESFRSVPDLSLLQGTIGGLLTAAGLSMENLQKVYVSLPIQQEVFPIQEKMETLFSRLPENRLHYVGLPHLSGAKAALLSDEERQKMKELQQKTVFIR